MNGKEKTNITADEVIRLRSDGEQDITPSDETEEVMILSPAVITNRLFNELAKHWSKVKPNKPR